jgi:hypothetical protein
LPTVENGYEIDVVKKICSRKKRRVYMNKKLRLPKAEKDVLEKISDWCADRHPRVEVQKSEYEKLIEKTGEKKIIDATVIGRYKRKSKSGAKGCLIAELEFEEHKQKKYSILKDMTKITCVIRKLSYWRNDIPQYWIKVDSDGTPFMINYRHVYENRHITEGMPSYQQYTRPDQTIRIIAADREDKNNVWPKHVIVGWDKIFKELHRVVRLAKF